MMQVNNNKKKWRVIVTCKFLVPKAPTTTYSDTFFHLDFITLKFWAKKILTRKIIRANGLKI